jgi:hypothetical protein
LLKLAQFYPSDFSEWELSILKINWRTVVWICTVIVIFLGKGIDELSQKLVEKKKHIVYPLIYISIDITGDHH